VKLADSLSQRNFLEKWEEREEGESIPEKKLEHSLSNKGALWIQQTFPILNLLLGGGEKRTLSAAGTKKKKKDGGCFYAFGPGLVLGEGEEGKTE